MSEREADKMLDDAVRKAYHAGWKDAEAGTIPRERVEVLVAALRDIASVDRDFVEANGGAEDAIDKIIGHAQAALEALDK
jgi:hypothetical protein